MHFMDHMNKSSRHWEFSIGGSSTVMVFAILIGQWVNGLYRKQSLKKKIPAKVCFRSSISQTEKQGDGKKKNTSQKDRKKEHLSKE